MSAVSDVIFDVLVASGTELPPSGQGGGERYRFAFPPSAEVTPLNSGEVLTTMTRYKHATLTITAVQSDAANTVGWRLAARQDAGERLEGGQATLVLTGQTVRWGRYTITQKPDIVSSSTVVTVTWTVVVENVTLTPGA